MSNDLHSEENANQQFAPQTHYSSASRADVQNAQPTEPLPAEQTADQPL